MANFYKYSYFRKSGKVEHEVSEIQEEPDEDYEENFSKILNKALDYDNQIQTEGGLEVEEIEESTIHNLFEDRNHALSEIQTSVKTNIKPSLHTLRITTALKNIGQGDKN